MSDLLVVMISAGTTSFSYGNVFKNDVSYFQRLYIYNPYNPFVIQWLATLEIRKKDFQTALQLLEKVKSLTPIYQILT